MVIGAAAYPAAADIFFRLPLDFGLLAIADGLNIFSGLLPLSRHVYSLSLSFSLPLADFQVNIRNHNAGLGQLRAIRDQSPLVHDSQLAPGNQQQILNRNILLISVGEDHDMPFWAPDHELLPKG